MKIWFNFSISAVVAIIFVVSLASARNVLQKSIGDNQSRPDISSVKQSSDIHSTISYNDYVEKFTTDATMDTILVMSPFNNIMTSSEDITTEMSTSSNITTTFVEETDPNTYDYTTSTEETSVEMVTEDDEDIKEYVPPKYGGHHYGGWGHHHGGGGHHYGGGGHYHGGGGHYIIRDEHIKTPVTPICPAGQTVNSNGGCSPIFVDR